MYCPKCRKKREISEIRDRSSMRRKELPYFMCGPCGLMHFNKAMVRKTIYDWKKGVDTNKTPKELFNAAMQTLKEHAKGMGCRVVRFNKKP